MDRNPDELVIDDDGNEVEPIVEDTETNDADTDTETVDETAAADTDVTDTETEPASEEEPVDPYQQRFDELGLGNQYGSPLDVIERAKDSNRYLDTLEKTTKAQQQELDRLRELERQAAAKPKLSPEEIRERLDIDPEGALSDAGFVRAENVEQLETKLENIERRQRSQELANTIEQYPELKSVASAFRLGREPVRGTNQFWDHMNSAMTEYPGLENAPIHTILAVLHPVVKKRIAAQQRPPVPKVPEKDKAEANTNAGRPAGGASDKPDFSRMGADEIRAYYEQRGQVGP